MSLANKYRPSSFDEVVGQSTAVSILTGLPSGKPLLLYGPSGSGKTTCARLFAAKHNYATLEVDCASYNGVNDISEIIKNNTALINNRQRLIIFDEAHALSSAAWISLLISLENEQFACIFCTTNVDKIDRAILSRLICVGFSRITAAEMHDKISQIIAAENISCDDDALTLLLSRSNDNMRQALTNLEMLSTFEHITCDTVLQVLGTISDKQIYELFHMDAADAAKEIHTLYMRDVDLYKMLNTSLEYFVRVEDIDNVRFVLDILHNIPQDTRYSAHNLEVYLCARFLARG